MGSNYSSCERRWLVSAQRLAVLPPSAFFLIGLFIWGIRTWKKEQVEKPAFKMAPQVSNKEAY